MPHTRHCAVCGGDNRTVLFSQSFATVDALTPVKGYDVVACDRCGFVYADGIPEQAAFDRYYRELSKYEYAQREGAESDYDRQRLQATADALAPLLQQRALRILDVGCASGRLLANMRERGFANVAGLDPSPVCAATAARLYGIPVQTMTLGELAASLVQHDVVIMVGVVEHLRDLDAAFRDLRMVLPKGGLLYVEVPDATAFSEWPNAPYQDFSTEHINFFSPASLGNLMRRHGFSQVFLEQNHRVQSYKTVMSNISAAYRMETAATTQAMAFDATGTDGIQRYLRDCAAEDTRLRATVDAIVDVGRPILVWGVGTHTSRLLATSRLAEANIAAFIESNARYQGKTLHGRPILAPAALKDRDEPVLISSRVFQQEIADQIRNDLGCGNELLLLYDV